MKPYLRMAVLLSLANLLGCSDPPPATPASATAPAEAAAPNQISEDRQGILTDTQREGINAANQMSNTLEEAEKKRREQMEAQGI